jgi:hypothetical protein
MVKTLPVHAINCFPFDNNPAMQSAYSNMISSLVPVDFGFVTSETSNFDSWTWTEGFAGAASDSASTSFPSKCKSSTNSLSTSGRCCGAKLLPGHGIGCTVGSYVVIGIMYTSVPCRRTARGWMNSPHPPQDIVTWLGTQSCCTAIVCHGRRSQARGFERRRPLNAR